MEIEIKTNIKLRLFRKFSQGLDINEMPLFISKITNLTEKEADNLDIDTVFDVLIRFKEELEKKQSFLGEKLSQ